MSRPPRWERRWRRLRVLGVGLGRLASLLAMGVALGVIMVVAAVGTGLAVGYRPVVITGGSMGATVPDGSLVVAQPVAEVEVGDVLVMRGRGRATVTHRVLELEPGVEGGPTLAVTRGDANPQADPVPYPLGPEELVARWVIPGFGGFVLEMASPLVGTGLVAAVVAILSAAALRRIWRHGSAGPEPEPRPDSGRGADGGVAPETVADPVLFDGAGKGSGPRLRPGYGRGAPGAVLRPGAGGGPTGAPTTRHRWLRPSRNRPRGRRLAALAVASMVIGVAGVAWALYIDSAAVPANQFSTRECYDARLDGVQKGQVVSTGAGTETVTIDAVDPERSFLVFTVRSSANKPADNRVLGQLASATTVTFLRNTNTGSPPAMTIEWSVVSYACGVTVQRGATANNGTTQIDVPITAVDPTASFVLGTSVPDITALTWSDNDLITYELTSATNLRIRTGTEAAIGSAAFAWQVVTFDDPADAEVQTVSATLGVGDGTATVDLAVPVDLQSTFLVASPSSTSGGVDIGERALRVRLVDADTVEVYRAVTTETASATVQVVSLAEGSTVQHGLITLDPAQTAATVTVDPVDVDRSTAFTTVMEPGALSLGATDFTADDVVGEASATAVLSGPTSLVIERGASASTASFAWQVVTWGGPAWADAAYPFRQRVDVAAGSVDAPDGYTTSVQVDHQALVEAGLSLASGDDLRLWRYDGSSWTELDRVLDPGSAWNSATSTLWFRTQEPIAATTVVSYWLYFGKPSAGAPPADPDNVWLLREGFESGLGHFEDRTGGTGWYSAQPWTRRIVLSIEADAVDANLADQPVLVRLTSADLAAQAQADGSDIRFTAADGTTALAHELEAYDPGTGTLTAWVLVPSVDASADTTIHLYYGASDAPAQASPRAVWVNELAAWHLARSRTGPAPSLDDSSTTNLDGTALGDTTLVDTASGPAADLDGTADRLESSPRDLPAGPLTVSAWFLPDSVTGSPVLVSQGDPSGAGVFELAVVAGTPRFRIRAGGSLVELSGGTVTAGTWHHVTVTWNGTTVTLYVNGVPVGTAAASGSTVDGTSIPTVLGGDAAGTRVLDGRLGEVRLSDRVWSAAEVRFSDQNLRNPGTTVVAGAATGGSWLGQGTWTVRRPLAVDHELVAADLTDYPLLVQVTDAALAASAQSDGDDLVFVAADGTTRLDHELESWNGTTGALTAWVRIPTLSSTVDTELFLYLGNGSARNQEDPVGVWGPDADLVLNG